MKGIVTCGYCTFQNPKPRINHYLILESIFYVEQRGSMKVVFLHHHAPETPHQANKVILWPNLSVQKIRASGDW